MSRWLVPVACAALGCVGGPEAPVPPGPASIAFVTPSGPTSLRAALVVELAVTGDATSAVVLVDGRTRVEVGPPWRAELDLGDLPPGRHLLGARLEGRAEVAGPIVLEIDRTPPEVVAISPLDRARPGEPIVVRFSEVIDPTELHVDWEVDGALRRLDPTPESGPISFSFPAPALAPGPDARARLSVAGVRDLAGNAMPELHSLYGVPAWRRLAGVEAGSLCGAVTIGESTFVVVEGAAGPSVFVETDDRLEPRGNFPGAACSRPVRTSSVAGAFAYFSQGALWLALLSSDGSVRTAPSPLPLDAARGEASVARLGDRLYAAAAAIGRVEVGAFTLGGELVWRQRVWEQPAVRPVLAATARDLHLYFRDPLLTPRFDLVGERFERAESSDLTFVAPAAARLGEGYLLLDLTTARWGAPGVMPVRAGVSLGLEPSQVVRRTLGEDGLALFAEPDDRDQDVTVVGAVEIAPLGARLHRLPAPRLAIEGTVVDLAIAGSRDRLLVAVEAETSPALAVYVENVPPGERVARQPTPRPLTSGCFQRPIGTAPARLADTGCYGPDGLEPAPGVLPYSVRAPLWSDGTWKRRFLVLPPGAKLSFLGDGRSVLPDGAVLIKEFWSPPEPRTGPYRIEVRFLVVHTDRDYEVYSYRARGADGELLSGEAPLVESIEVPTATGTRTRRHLYPSREQCFTCHIEPGRVLGLDLDQLDRLVDDRGVVDHQLDRLRDLGIADVTPLEGRSTPRLVDPEDVREPVDTRLRSYLAGNCAHCHPPHRSLDLRIGTKLLQTGICDVVEPGFPDRSRLYGRVTGRITAAMPPLGVLVRDPLLEQLTRAFVLEGANDCR